MYVKFRLHESVIKPENVFRLIKQAMQEHWEIVKETPFGAEFITSTAECTYITCCDNVWSVKMSDTVYLEYEGSRAGFYAQTIFDEKIKFEPVITHKTEELHMLVKQEYGDYERIAVFKLVEYRTTTPKEWNIKWYHLILPTADKKYAVVIDPTVTTTFYNLCIIKIVPYRNVYNS